MPTKTAIFYDIENLIGGYGNMDMISSLSLKDIFTEITSLDLGQIAIQRAYANWSDPRLRMLRGDIVELGIDPIQMFGFGKGSVKNASDIQLAIDAVETVLTKEHIDNYVIVSGDGGFSSLAKKLHEYGKLVIGCAYHKTSNKVFEAVSDHFIWLEQPKEEIEKNTESNPALLNDPVVNAFVRANSRLSMVDQDTLIAESRAILEFLSANRDAHRLLSGMGLNISVFSQILEYRFEDFSYYRLGFVRLIDFIRFISHGTSCKLVFKAPSEYRLVMNYTKVKGYEELEFIKELSSIHTVDNYRKLLGRGGPAYKQFSKEILLAVSEYMTLHKLDFQGVHFGDIMDLLDDHVSCDMGEIKTSVVSMIAAGCLMREPEDGKLSEVKLSLILSSPEQIMEKLEQGMKGKLEETLEEYDVEIFNQIME